MRHFREDQNEPFHIWSGHALISAGPGTHGSDGENWRNKYGVHVVSSPMPMNRKVDPHQTPNLLLPWSWTCQPPELQQINVGCLSHPVCDIFVIASWIEQAKTIAIWLRTDFLLEQWKPEVMRRSPTVQQPLQDSYLSGELFPFLRLYNGPFHS